MYAMAVSPAGWTRGRSEKGKRTGQLRQLPLFPKSGRWLSILAGAFKGPRYRYARAQNSMLTILLRRECDIQWKRELNKAMSTSFRTSNPTLFHPGLVPGFLSPLPDLPQPTPPLPTILTLPLPPLQPNPQHSLRPP